MESKTSRDATMPNSNASGASAKPPRIISAQNGKAQQRNNEGDDDSEDSAVYKLRIQMIKEKILAKLKMDREPVLKEKPKESKLAALLANLKLIGQDNDENQPQDSEDDYYGKTTKMIVFSEKGRR